MYAFEDNSRRNPRVIIHLIIRPLFHGVIINPGVINAPMGVVRGGRPPPTFIITKHFYGINNIRTAKRKGPLSKGKALMANKIASLFPFILSLAPVFRFSFPLFPSIRLDYIGTLPAEAFAQSRTCSNAIFMLVSPPSSAYIFDKINTSNNQ